MAYDHTFTAESDLSRQGAVRQVIYAWGKGGAGDLAAVTKLLGLSHVAVHVRDLIDGFRAGLAGYLDEVALNPERLQRVEAGVGLWFGRLDPDTVKRFLDISQNLVADTQRPSLGLR